MDSARARTSDVQTPGLREISVCCLSAARSAMFSHGSLDRLKAQLCAGARVSEKVLGMHDRGARPPFTQPQRCAWYKVALGLPSADLGSKAVSLRGRHPALEERLGPCARPLCAAMRTLLPVFWSVAFRSVCF